MKDNPGIPNSKGKQWEKSSVLENTTGVDYG